MAAFRFSGQTLFPFAKSKPIFPRSGCNEALLAKVIANVDGVRFVAGMSYERISTYSSKLPKPQSFLGCTQQLADMRPDEFFGLGGFAVALKPECLVRMQCRV